MPDLPPIEDPPELQSRGPKESLSKKTSQAGTTDSQRPSPIETSADELAIFDTGRVAVKDSAGATLVMRSKSEALDYINERYPWNAHRFGGAENVYKFALTILFTKEV